MPRGRLWMMVVATCLGTGCSIADSHRPEWLEALGHASVRWIAATPFGVLAIVPGGKIRRYPGEWDRPWFDHLAADAIQLAANQTVIWTLTADGNLVRRNDVRAAGETLTNGGGGITRFAVSSSGDVHVLARGHPQRLVDGRLVDTPCAARPAQALAVAADGTYLVTTIGSLALETAAGACVDGQFLKPERAPRGTNRPAVNASSSGVGGRGLPLGREGVAYSTSMRWGTAPPGRSASCLMASPSWRMALSADCNGPAAGPTLVLRRLTSRRASPAPSTARRARSPRSSTNASSTFCGAVPRVVSFDALNVASTNPSATDSNTALMRVSSAMRPMVSRT
ncbi:MAG TPA: hypothetical protein VH374_04980 [Polyangia bacterium]|nr:hypothetical protein [Polyangia bacterium]